METKLVKTKDLKSNSGQIVGLPKNPRFIKDDKFLKLKNSIEADPEMLELREIIAYDNNGELVVICGNMRLQASIELGLKSIPTKILPKETPIQKLKAYLIKDNVSFGDNDWELMANEWEAEELDGWGVDVIGFDANADEFGDEFSLADGDKSPFEQITFTLSNDQAIEVRNALATIKETSEFKYADSEENENSNGNALFLIVTQWQQHAK
jgi:hypothetical protein